MTANLEVPAEDLVQIVQSVFETMLSLDVAPSQVPWFPGSDRLTATVHLSGEWSGAVSLECDRSQARRFAGRYLSIVPPDTTHEVVRDVLGELANMIGGNMKCVLMRGIQISMPSVADRSPTDVHKDEMEAQHRLTFQCADGVFWLTSGAKES